MERKVRAEVADSPTCAGEKDEVTEQAPFVALALKTSGEENRPLATLDLELPLESGDDHICREMFNRDRKLAQRPLIADHLAEPPVQLAVQRFLTHVGEAIERLERIGGTP